MTLADHGEDIAFASRDRVAVCARAAWNCRANLGPTPIRMFRFGRKLPSRERPVPHTLSTKTSEITIARNSETVVLKGEDGRTHQVRCRAKPCRDQLAAGRRGCGSTASSAVSASSICDASIKCQARDKPRWTFCSKAGICEPPKAKAAWPPCSESAAVRHDFIPLELLVGAHQRRRTPAAWASAGDLVPAGSPVRLNQVKWQMVFAP